LVKYFKIIPLSKVNSDNFKDEKQVALSNTRELGTLNLVMMYCSRKLITTSSFTLTSGTTSIQCVKQMIEVRLYLCFLEEWGLISPMMSIPHCSEGSSIATSWSRIKVVCSLPATL
jgi:hypothetical protein